VGRISVAETSGLCFHVAAGGLESLEAPPTAAEEDVAGASRWSVTAGTVADGVTLTVDDGVAAGLEDEMPLGSGMAAVSWR
jgi:hypothetical protein